MPIEKLFFGACACSLPSISGLEIQFFISVFSNPKLANIPRDLFSAKSIFNSKPLLIPSAAFWVKYKKVLGSEGSTWVEIKTC